MIKQLRNPSRLRQSIIRTVVMVPVGLALVSLPVAAPAQAPTQRFGGGSKRASSAPYQQRLSPYLDLLRSDNSILSPYHSFVQPRQQLRLNQNRQAEQLRNLERTIQRSAAPTSQSERMQTGRGGTFNNYLHYYQFNSALQR
ncbi:hypothetical protein [Stieleria sp.]|uniref:hypothetical protein n=1 Tax=Stieleria sp. TaxID=2795976 RepID=UPI00356488FA